MTLSTVPTRPSAPYWTMSPDRFEAWRGNAPDAWSRFEANNMPVQARDEDGWSPLRWAVHARNLDVMGRLIALGADLTDVSRENGTLVEQAFTEKSADVALKLLNAGAPMEVTDGSPLAQRWAHEALAWGHAALFDAVVSRPASVPTGLIHQGRTELHALIDSRFRPAEKAWRIPTTIARGNPVDALDNNGFTALMRAVMQGPAGEALLVPLLNAGALPTACTPHKLSVLGLARQRNNVTALAIFDGYALQQELRNDPTLAPGLQDSPRPARARL